MKGLKAIGKVSDQIVRILQANVQSNKRAFLCPGHSTAVLGRVDG